MVFTIRITIKSRNLIVLHVSLKKYSLMKKIVLKAHLTIIKDKNEKQCLFYNH